MEKVKAKYLIIPSLPFGIRATLIVVLIVAGLLIQLFYSRLLEGFFLILIGSGLGAMPSIKSKPTGIVGRSYEWEDVSIEEWEKASELREKGIRWKRDITNVASGPGAALSIILFILCLVIFISNVDEDDMLLLVFVADVIALFVPVLMIGQLKAWNPPGLDTKLVSLINIYKHLKTTGGDELRLQPMMEFRKGEKDDKPTLVPTDARMMIRLEGAPEGFYGVQVQCSLNEVGGTSYPYVYAVIILKKDFPLDPSGIPSRSDKNLVFEHSVTEEVITLVIRQKTTKTSGYHTNEKRQIEILDSALAAARKIITA